ncbi:rho guanine nucleotide exchange factor 18 [Bombina bombina]|uniref:rho guanine nucleotide exchange factor 18 n=1 Tax=Bombina bombina TaxID=8345 RepID=UPI00235A489E|nr:rho guanine nucleotide exchange factor 18 [Bombina bombina]
MVQSEPDVLKQTAGLNVPVTNRPTFSFKMSDSLLNHSWPSFSKLWMKRWSFKRASECKPCSEFSAIPDSRSVTPDTDTSQPSLVSGEEAYFMAGEKDDVSVDLDESIVSSNEDLPSMDSSLLGSEYYKDLELMESSESISTQPETKTQATATFCVTGETNISFDKGEVIITYTKPFLCPMVYGDSAMPELALTGYHEEKNEGSLGQEKTATVEERIPILVRSLSTSRRHSWDDAVSPTETVRRFSLDASDMENVVEKVIEAATSIQTLSVPGPFITKANLRIEPNIENLDLQVFETDKEDGDSLAGRLRSKSVPSTLDKIATTRMSRSLESSCPAIEVSLPPQLETIEKDHVEPTHVLYVQQVLQELKHYHGTKNKQEGSREPKQNVTWFEFLSNEVEDTGKPEKVEKGTKVKRRLSSLKNRVTGSWQKDKGKMKEQLKEKGREPKDKWIDASGHKLVPGCFSNHAKCTLCTKALANGHGLQCMHCAVNVHKNCKTLLPECNSNKLRKDNYQKPVTSFQVSSYQQASLKDHPRVAIVGLEGSHAPTRGLGMTVTHRGNSRVELHTTAGSRASATTVDMEEVDSGFGRLRLFSEDAISLAPSTTESIFVEDSYSSVRTELEADTIEFEAESWSRAVDPSYAEKLKEEVIKRQDVIYELMQTEMHHVRTIKIMLKVYLRALKEELQYGHKEIQQIFPCVDDLLELHSHFFTRFKERRKESMEEGSDRNYFIQKVGDILVQQFSGDTGDRMKEKYGHFCSNHNKAVSYYKELMRESKKFQNLMKKIGNSSTVRRLGVLECILLVTQRITKYPVLVERIIQNTEEGTEDYEALTRALTLIKETITEVDTRVHENEKLQRLREIVDRMELKSTGKLKNGTTFRKQDMLRRKLLYDGMLYWKTASGRLKDILAVLLTDVLLLLQEKDQKYSFSSVDSKPPVISLQKLIVREVANEEKAMFLISASLKGPEMYEIHTSSKEERNGWMTIIREAVERCPDEVVIEPSAERFIKFKEFQDRLNLKDDAITKALSEKLQIFQDMGEMFGFEDSQGSRSRLLLTAENGETLQGESILRSAITEAESIYNMLLSQLPIQNILEEDNSGNSILPRRSETFGGYDSNSNHTTGSFRQKVRDRSTTSSISENPIQESDQSELALSRLDINNTPVIQDYEPAYRMQMLLQLLYSLQALITQQDSYVEVHKEREKQFRHQSSRGNWLLEQEKQRNFEKQREELANVQKLQDQLRQERHKWEREWDKQQRMLEATEAQIQQREEASRLEKERLNQERVELETQREAYQHDLERLRESQRAVEKERERLEQLKKIKKANSGPFSPDLVQGLSHSSSFNGEGMLSLEGPGQLVMKPTAKSTPSVSAADYLERPELTRRDSSVAESRLTLKNEVPIHLLSATNQIQKQAAVQQKIPTKLAALSKGGREKSSRGKASHRTDSSASIDHRQLLPNKLSGNIESSLRSKRSASPILTSSQVFLQQETPVQVDPSSEALHYAPSLYRPSSNHLLQTLTPPPMPPPPPPVEDEANREDVIFF